MLTVNGRIDAACSPIDAVFLRAGDASLARQRLTRAYRDLVQSDPHEPVVLFGSGAWGRHTARRLVEHGRRILAFADNAPHAQGTTVEGIGVLSPDQAVERHGRNALFVTTIYNGSAARRQLAALGCARVLSALSFYHGLDDLFLPYYQIDGADVVFEARRTIGEVESMWSDARSRNIFASRVAAMLGLPPNASEPVGLPRDCYLDPQLIAIGPDECVVDCGAFDGDTIHRLLARGTALPARIVALEPDPINVLALRSFVAGLDPAIGERIEAIEAAASKACGEASFAASGTVAAQVGSGAATVRTIALDDLAGSRPPSYVKMDIEGHECEALEGAVRLMRDAPPVLAISLYHRASDLWRIPQFIKRSNPSYRLFLRCYAEDGWESVCYAIPPGRHLPGAAA